jgi:hypothetical protein
MRSIVVDAARPGSRLLRAGRSPSSVDAEQRVESAWLVARRMGP